MVAIDVVQPNRWTYLNVYETKGLANSVAVDDGLAYVANGQLGLQVVRLNPPLGGVGWLADDTLVLTVPPGVSAGPYHVRATNGEPACVAASMFAFANVSPGGSFSMSDP